MNRYFVHVLSAIVIVTAGGPVWGHTFSNATPITRITAGPGNPYPSSIVVSGVDEAVTGVSVKLIGLTHTNPDDLDVLLVGPNGKAVRLMSDCGGSDDVAGLTLTFRDGAAALADSTTLSAGTFAPSEYDNETDEFPGPAPAQGGSFVYDTTLSVFEGTSGNGTWSLYVFDDEAPGSGIIAGGWSITLSQEIGGGFSYQGRLKQAGAPFDGIADFQFKLTNGKGQQVGAIDTLTNVLVSEGIFNVQLNDNNEFGAGAFNGEERSLEISVAIPPGSAFVPLTPAQPITSAPYCTTAQTLKSGDVAIDGSLSTSGGVDVTGSVNVSGGVDVVGSVTVGGGLGTHDDTEPLELRVGNRRAVRATYASHTVFSTTYSGISIVAGSPSNEIAPDSPGATIAGGGLIIDGVARPNIAKGVGVTVGGGADNVAGDANNFFGSNYATVAGGRGNEATEYGSSVGGGVNNVASGNYGTIGGGEDNVASEFHCVVAGGGGNTAEGTHSTVGGGQENTAIGWSSTVSGGSWNTTTLDYDTVGGGFENAASGGGSTVPGGSENLAGGTYSFAAGRRAKVRDAVASGDSDGDEGTFVWGDSTDADFISTGPDQFLIRASGGVGVHTNEPLAKLHVRNEALSLQASALESDDIVIESTDASLGLYSTSSGASGSAVSLKEIDGTGLIANTWGIYRRTTPSGGALRFTYGTGEDYSANAVRMELGTTGNLSVTGTLSKGGGSFKIDHPLDPENKYLYHSFVESPDMKNVYDGVARTDAAGYATITLPEYFGALNSDFRYQLTVIDESDSAQWVMARVVRKIKDNKFTIRSSRPNVEVSWQVTGIRQDAFAKANRIATEVEKATEDKGQYLHPEAFGLPAERGIGMNKKEEER